MRKSEWTAGPALIRLAIEAQERELALAKYQSSEWQDAQRRIRDLKKQLSAAEE